MLRSSLAFPLGPVKISGLILLKMNFILNILAIFATSNRIVNSNYLADNFLHELDSLEA